MIYYGEKLYNPLILDWKFSFSLMWRYVWGMVFLPSSPYLLAALVR